MRTRCIGALLALLAILGVIAVFAARWWTPDSEFYIGAAERRIRPGCAEIHCFRVLMPWAIGVLPGPSVVKWKASAVLLNAAAAIAVFDLCLVLGLSRRASLISAILTAFGFGSLYTLFEPYRGDSLMFFLAPLVTRWALEDRMMRAGVAASIGVFAKEFVLVPLAMVAAVDAWAGRWRRAFRAAAAAAAGFVVWLGLNAFLRLQFGYTYGPNRSPQLLAGSYLAVWLHNMAPGAALTAIFNEFGAAYLLIPFGWVRAPARLRQLVVAAVPFALALCYVEQPDRALWNFHFVAGPLAALVLEPMATGFVAAFLALYAVANLRVGAQILFVPQARYMFAIGLVLASVAVLRVLQSVRRRAAAS